MFPFFIALTICFVRNESLLFRAKRRGARSAERRAPSAERRAPSAERSDFIILSRAKRARSLLTARGLSQLPNSRCNK